MNLVQYVCTKDGLIVRTKELTPLVVNGMVPVAHKMSLSSYTPVIRRVFSACRQCRVGFIITDLLKTCRQTEFDNKMKAIEVHK